MKTFATKLAAIVATTVISLSGLAFADAQGIQVGIGYRQDSLKWNIRDNAVINPRVKANTHFKDLEIFTLGVKYKGLLGCEVYTRASYDYGWVLDGRKREKNTSKYRRDADHFDCDGLIVEGGYELSILSNRTKNSSYVWDVNFGVGKPIENCWCPELKIAPMVGFAYDRHNLKFKGNDRRYNNSSSDNNYASSDDCSNNNHHSRGSSFKTSFWGPWIGFDFAYNSEGCWNVFGEFELHFGRAERERNTHHDLAGIDCFQHTKDFWGPTFRLGANYMFCDCWYVEGTVGYQYWGSYGCHDQLYWSSATTRLDLGYMF